MKCRLTAFVKTIEVLRHRGGARKCTACSVNRSIRVCLYSHTSRETKARCMGHPLSWYRAQDLWATRPRPCLYFSQAAIVLGKSTRTRTFRRFTLDVSGFPYTFQRDCVCFAV